MRGPRAGKAGDMREWLVIFVMMMGVSAALAGDTIKAESHHQSGGITTGKMDKAVVAQANNVKAPAKAPVEPEEVAEVAPPKKCPKCAKSAAAIEKLEKEKAGLDTRIKRMEQVFRELQGRITTARKLATKISAILDQ